MQGQGAASRPVQLGGSSLVADFGADCPIGTTRHLILTLSNHTAMQAPVQLWVDKFEASTDGEHGQCSRADRLWLAPPTTCKPAASLQLPSSIAPLSGVPSSWQQTSKVQAAGPLLQMGIASVPIGRSPAPQPA